MRLVYDDTFPISYLGAPIICVKVTFDMFDLVLAMIKKKITIWKGRLLYVGGKHSLIEIVMSSTLHVNIYSPKKVIEVCLHHLFAKFFWSEIDGFAKVHWISLLKVCRVVD